MASPPKRPRRAPTTTPPPGPALLKGNPEGERRVTLAVVIGAHGVTGQVRLKVFAEDFGAYRAFNDGALTLMSSTMGNNGLIARFAEIADRAAAEALRGTELTIPRSALPPLGEGEYYHADLIGLAAVDPDGTPIGTVVAIDDFGAGDVVEIERPAIDGRAGQRFMVPMTVDAVPEWDAERLVVSPDYVERSTT